MFLLLKRVLTHVISSLLNSGLYATNQAPASLPHHHPASSFITSRHQPQQHCLYCLPFVPWPLPPQLHAVSLSVTTCIHTHLSLSHTLEHFWRGRRVFYLYDVLVCDNLMQDRSTPMETTCTWSILYLEQATVCLCLLVVNVPSLSCFLNSFRLT